LPSRLDYFAVSRDFITQRATRIDPAQVDVEGSDVNLIAGSSSVLADHVTKQLGYRVAALTLDGSFDEDLDRYAYDRYTLTRKGASPALGSVRIFRATTTGGVGTVALGTQLSTDDGAEYITTSTASFGAADLTSTANVRAVQAGKSTQAGAGAINRFSRPGVLFDPSLQAINDAATAGGEEVETDDLFKSRIRDFWRVARRGILAAIEFGAKTVPGVVSAQAVEALTLGNMPARVVNLYISDSSGVASNALADQVRAALNDFRAGGIAVIVSTSLPLIVDVELRLTFRAGVDTKTLTDNVKAAVFEFINSLPVNGSLYEAQLFSVLQRYADDGLIPDEGTIVAPVGDLVPAVGQTLRTTIGNIVAQ
jgi:hypothetical protein